MSALRKWEAGGAERANRAEGPAGFHCFNRTHLQFSFRANVSDHGGGRDINAPESVLEGMRRGTLVSAGFIEQNSGFKLTYLFMS